MGKYVNLFLLLYISTYLISFMSILHNTFITVEFFEFLIINFIIYFLVNLSYEVKNSAFLLIFFIIIFILHIISLYLSHLWGYTEKIIQGTTQPLRTENQIVILINVITIFSFLVIYLLYLLTKKYFQKKQVSFKDYFINVGLILWVFAIDFVIFFIINIFLLFWGIKHHGL